MMTSFKSHDVIFINSVLRHFEAIQQCYIYSGMQKNVCE